MFPRTSHRALLLTALSMCVLIVAGCAGIPRIDPSGERVFIWPRNQVPALGAATINAQAPALYTAPVFPQPILPSNQVPAGQVPASLAGLLPPLPQDRLTITPERVLAPVGSEVILKAGLCTRDNYLLTDSKVEWLIARDTVGEFVSLGGRGWKRNPLLPWNKPKKIDNQYAIGYTAKVPLQITRGTADPTDDVQVEPGEAWASVTSPVEGTTRITAVAPEIETWANRRATATIYWVDVQWTFPAPTVSAGGSQVLTTTVRRHTDGTPIEGWLVRYEVTDGTGALRGSGESQFVEVPTDAQGRASIDVTPTGSAGTTTRIATQIIRPERFQNSNALRLVIANGASTINWTDGGTDYLPTPDDLGSPLPSNPFPGGDVSPPIQPTPAARLGPKLELEVRLISDPQVEVGQQARFEVLIQNTGDSTATGIQLNDSFDAGLSHPADPDRVLQVKRTIRDISAGDVFRDYMTFDVLQAGNLCQNFTLTYDGGGSIERRSCIDVLQLRQQPQGRLQVTKQSPPVSNVGETALFTLAIKNVGDAPLTNIEIIEEYDRALLPKTTLPEARFFDGRLVWSIPRLEVDETARFEVNCRCEAAKLEACSTVSVSAETGAGSISTSENSCTKIRPVRQDVVPDVGPAQGDDVTPPVTPPPVGGGAVNPNDAGGLRMEILTLANPVRADTRMDIQIVISNRAPTSDRQVELRVLFPAELTPDVSAIQNDANVPAQFNPNNGELLFSPIKEVRNIERLVIRIPCNVLQPGVREITAELFSQKLPQGIRQTKPIEIIR